MTLSFPFHLTSYWIEFLKLSQHLLLIQRRYMIYEAPKVIKHSNDWSSLATKSTNCLADHTAVSRPPKQPTEQSDSYTQN